MAARAYVSGVAEGRVVRLSQPLSFWGGINSGTGRVVDRSHPELGALVAGHILVMPCGRGSSSSASVLTEALRRGTGPRGIVLERPDSILIVGALIARELYGIACPVVVAPPGPWQDGEPLRVIAGDDGSAALLPPA